MSVRNAITVLPATKVGDITKLLSVLFTIWLPKKAEIFLGLKMYIVNILKIK